jgi:hypothetical protein
MYPMLYACQSYNKDRKNENAAEDAGGEIR